MGYILYFLGFRFIISFILRLIWGFDVSFFLKGKISLIFGSLYPGHPCVGNAMYCLHMGTGFPKITNYFISVVNFRSGY